MIRTFRADPNLSRITWSSAPGRLMLPSCSRSSAKVPPSAAVTRTEPGDGPPVHPCVEMFPLSGRFRAVRRRRRLESIVVISITAVIWRRRRGGGIKVLPPGGEPVRNVLVCSNGTMIELAPTFDLTVGGVSLQESIRSLRIFYCCSVGTSNLLQAEKRGETEFL